MTVTKSGAASEPDALDRNGARLFNSGWSVKADADGDFAAIQLPHDAMLSAGRSADAPSGSHGGYFHGGRYQYRKHWHAPEALAGKEIWLHFEGAYRHSEIRVNDTPVGGWIGGNDAFRVRIDPVLDYGADNRIDVVVDNRVQPSARWYTGSGLYRPVWLIVRDPVHILFDGVHFSTRSVGAGQASVSVQVGFANPDRRDLAVRVQLEQDGRAVAAGDKSAKDGPIEFNLDVPDARVWSDDTPHLYDLVVILSDDQGPRDTAQMKVGLRTIEISGRDGLRVNGKSVLLRGGNIHHDHGPLGAASFADAEYRRARILKEAGFNAVRTGHAPASRAFLEACDAYGLYVLDELFDGWYDHKVAGDDAESFAAIWRGAAEAMVAKDRNHASVFLYSIGNENSEPETAFGVETARVLAEHVRALDPTRGVTIGVNLMAAAIAWRRVRKGSSDTPPSAKAAPNMDSALVNVITNQFARLMKLTPRLARTDAVTRDLFGIFDVAGYNYGTVRYARDAALHPDRAIAGTETVPGDIAETWKLVEAVPNVIGDFLWSAWDYLGEAGLGSWSYGKGRARLYKPFPELSAGCGTIDLIGNPDASLFHARAAWGLGDGPEITVRPLDRAGQKYKRTAWRSTDAVASWAWKGCAGRTASVEVVSRDEAVDLTVNGVSHGRQPVTDNVARFTVPYMPGAITAVSYRAGRETGRATLRSAGKVQLALVIEPAERPGDGDRLLFVRIELRDAAGVVEMCDDDRVELNLEGPALLAGFGSAAPRGDEDFTDAVHRTYRGRALAIVRLGDDPGAVTLTATSRRHGTARAQLHTPPETEEAIR